LIIHFENSVHAGALDELNIKCGAPDSSRSRKKVKAEVKSEPLSHAGRFADGDIIDLTDD
jgi:hypothetical protein